ncbi:uncharacterized protein LOC131875340 [Cryptomeria japonica]|uniref:uncharacterized protein LOC131875340 n=1 Tax=Cryptomeria japonica TaxID=3369 RepID=UPI0027DA48EB|nr:uncharacterized protein LOC131875340 [Cryptomeria japonica]
MLIANLWIGVGLVNGSFGQIKMIVYNAGSKPPDLPKYVVVHFQHYIGPPWDAANPKYVPIPPITRGNRTQIPLTMAWGITIHKSQRLTLDYATIDIEKTEKQGLTFTAPQIALSRVKSIEDLRIQPTFTYERCSKLQGSPSTISRKNEEAHLLKLSKITKTKHLQKRPTEVLQAQHLYIFAYHIAYFMRFHTS